MLFSLVHCSAYTVVANLSVHLLSFQFGSLLFDFKYPSTALLTQLFKNLSALVSAVQFQFPFSGADSLRFTWSFMSFSFVSAVHFLIVLCLYSCVNPFILTSAVPVCVSVVQLPFLLSSSRYCSDSWVVPSLPISVSAIQL